MSEKAVREYTRREESPGIKDMKAYQRWYYLNVTQRELESPEAKAARYRLYSARYWRGFCTRNGLDPDTWEEVKRLSEEAKALRREYARRRYGGRARFNAYR